MVAHFAAWLRRELRRASCSRELYRDVGRELYRATAANSATAAENLVAPRSRTVPQRRPGTSPRPRPANCIRRDGGPGTSPRRRPGNSPRRGRELCRATTANSTATAARELHRDCGRALRRDGGQELTAPQPRTLPRLRPGTSSRHSRELHHGGGANSTAASSSARASGRRPARRRDRSDAAWKDSTPAIAAHGPDRGSR